MDNTTMVRYLKVALGSLKEAGTQGIPAGHLYAAFMTKGMNLDQYNKLESMLTKVFKINKSSYLLTWTKESEELLGDRK